MKEAEIEFDAAVAGAPDQVAALLKRAHTLEKLGLRNRADDDLARASQVDQNDPRPWVLRGKLLAGRGLGNAADEAYAHALALSANRLDPFIEAGWWIAGPFPPDMRISQGVEDDPDPSRPISGANLETLEWRSVSAKRNRLVNLGFIHDQPNSSVYALTHIPSDRERTIIIFFGGGRTVRIWLNGRIVFEPDLPNVYHQGTEYSVPVALKPGRNTLLVRVSDPSSSHWLRLRTDDYELDRAWLSADFGRFDEAADLFDAAGRRGQLYQSFPMARKVQFLAGLGDRKRYLESAALLADWDGPSAIDPGSTALALELIPNDLISPDRLIELARQAAGTASAGRLQHDVVGLALYRAGRYREALDYLQAHRGKDEKPRPVEGMALWHLENRATRAKSSLSSIKVSRNGPARAKAAT